MKKTIVLIAALVSALCAGAQDKVTRTVLELGRTDNRTMEHSAVVQAVTAYGLANLNHLLSRDGLYKE